MLTHFALVYGSLRATMAEELGQKLEGLKVENICYLVLLGKS